LAARIQASTYLDGPKDSVRADFVQFVEYLNNLMATLVAPMAPCACAQGGGKRERAREIGFEWPVLRFAHGYLGQRLFSSHSNRHENEYGGSFVHT
jgi:hypothetical protein